MYSNCNSSSFRPKKNLENNSNKTCPSPQVTDQLPSRHVSLVSMTCLQVWIKSRMESWLKVTDYSLFFFSPQGQTGTCPFKF